MREGKRNREEGKREKVKSDRSKKRERGERVRC